MAHGEIEQGIRFGLEHEQFLPFFEPQLDLRTGEITGFEVLARWRHPLAGIIPPDRFIPIAEEIGVMDRLSEQVIGAALRRGARLGSVDRDFGQHLAVAILGRLAGANALYALLTETNFPAERLVVEITETSLFGDMDLARNIVTSLKNQGIRLALDDFGTGFSSLVAPALAAVRPHQDRPVVRHQHPRERPERRDRPCGGDACRRAGSADPRRGHRE